ncbi:uncharacterized protein LOC34622132 [Cyclospora cayetanensis]|nr:uncharacterized protein LOC34622132 [Cyclospora cayetanensis]
MSVAAGTRRSLLHDVLSHAEVVELGLDGSIDDLPPLTTRLTPSSARAVAVFSWCYFLCFWSEVAALARHVALSDSQTLLPGPRHFIFVALCTGFLVAAEFGMYCYLKTSNTVPDGGGAGVNQFNPSVTCAVAHFALSAAARMCLFLELLFLLHAFVLPTPMLLCASFTVCLTAGVVPFLLQLRLLVGCLCGDAFDPLQWSTCIPLSSLGAVLSRTLRLCSAVAFKGLHGMLQVARRARCRVVSVVGRCGGRVVPRQVTAASSRRPDLSCCAPGSDSSACEDFDSREPGAPAGSGRDEEEATHKELPTGAGTSRLGAWEPALASGESGRDELNRANASLPSSSCTVSMRMEWPNGPAEESQGAAARAALLDRCSAEDPSRGGHTASTREPSVERQRPPVHSETRNRDSSRMFVSPPDALRLANCLLFLGVPALTLQFKVNFLPLEQLEAHEFLTSMVSLV